jgi:hypothetical protein
MDPPNGIPPRPLCRPIKPSEVVAAKKGYLPEIVFNVINEQIVMNWNGAGATVRYPVVVNILDDAERFSREDIHKMLDGIEEIYKSEGWSVVFDKPGYNESYAATWTFTKA